MANWTHPQCGICWAVNNIQTWEDENGHVEIGVRAPTRVITENREVCCFCGTPTIGGIYVREDPATLDCRGNHQEEEDLPTEGP